MSTYAYDDGDNLISKTEPFLDDFNDGNMTGWTTYGAIGVTSGAAKNTASTDWVGFYKANTDASYVLRFSYARNSNNTSDRLVVRLRNSGSDYDRLLIYGTSNNINQYVGGVSTNLSSATIATTQNAWYDIRVVCDGANITVWRGAKGGPLAQVLTTTSAAVSASVTTQFDIYANSVFSVDDIQLVGGSLGNVTTTYGYDAGNKMTTMSLNNVSTTIGYDAWGRMTGRTANSVTTSYAYRYGGKLYSVDLTNDGTADVTYDYGGNGKRRTRTASGVTTGYKWDAGMNVVGEENGSGALTRRYIGRSMAQIDGSTWTYFQHDHLGSTRMMTDGSKNVTGSVEFTPYGDQFAYAGTTSTTRLFTGHDWDPVTEQYFAPYRYYAPDMARWTTRDPLGMVDGPNMYGYVGGKVIRSSDLLGLFTIKGDCNGKQANIESEVKAACDNLSTWITDDKNKTCVAKRCKSAKIICKRNCNTPGCSDGASGYNVGVGKLRSKNAAICVDNGQDPGGFADTAIHEWLHSCNYHKQDEGDTAPYGYDELAAPAAPATPPTAPSPTPGPPPPPA